MLLFNNLSLILKALILSFVVGAFLFVFDDLNLSSRDTSAYNGSIYFLERLFQNPFYSIPQFEFSIQEMGILLTGDTYSLSPYSYLPDVSKQGAFSLLSAPKGISFDPATNKIHWTPNLTQVGLNEITYSVSKGDQVFF